MNINLRQIGKHKAGNTPCESCPTARLCFLSSLPTKEQGRFLEIINQRTVVQRGQLLFDHGEKTTSLHFICSGSVKTYNNDDSGNQQILRFGLPGDIIGLDSMYREVYGYSAIALETSSICQVSLNDFQNLANSSPSLNRQVIEYLANEIIHGDGLAHIRGQKSARVRLAYFLIFIEGKYARQGFSSDCINLTMTRREIAYYLGMSTETVSRTFTQFQKELIIDIAGKQVSIKDRKRLDGYNIHEARPVEKSTVH